MGKRKEKWRNIRKNGKVNRKTGQTLESEKEKWEKERKNGEILGKMGK